MKLKLVPARRGFFWVRQGFAAFMLRPIAFVGLYTSFLFVALVVLAVPYAGSVAALASLPLVTLAFMIATQHALQGRFPMPTVFIEPLRRGRPQTLALLKLGLIYAGCAMALVALSDVVDGGKFQALQNAMAASKAPEIEALLDDDQLQLGLLFRLAGVALLSLPFWHAPALVHWGGFGVGKAVFYSSVACWRNKGALTLFGLTWTALSMLFALLLHVLMLMLGQTGGAVMVLVPATLILTAVFYASLFFSFADSFEAPVTDTPAA